MLSRAKGEGAMGEGETRRLGDMETGRRGEWENGRMGDVICLPTSDFQHPTSDFGLPSSDFGLLINLL